MITKLQKTYNKGLEILDNRRLLNGLESDLKKLIQQIRKEKLTYLSVRKLISIARECTYCDQHKIPGLFIETGCALGGSSILIAKVKKKQRKLNVYDVFGMIPAPTVEDTEDVHQRYKEISEGRSTGIAGNKYYGYEDNLYEKVQSNFKRFSVGLEEHSVELIKGLVQDTLNLNGPVAIAHVDVDWYDPVKTCLDRIFPLLSPGGSIILDDYHHWGGCKKATDEFVLTIPGQYRLDDSMESMKLTKL